MVGADNRRREPRHQWWYLLAQSHPGSALVPAASIKTDSDGEMRVTRSFSNRGRGVGRDVRFGPDNVGSLAVFATRKVERAKFGESFSSTLVYPAGTTGSGAFMLTWGQELDLHRRRTMLTKYKLGDGRGDLPEPERDDVGIVF
ncbi:conserved hypothetical protein [Microbacterium sp. 8M]|uniref:hypothetical protein n=1 Tax=Microbacterium sp. 8M TaxID=2653153 RepID=UPI0012F18908|nr:hypothetical protein [Microbacterium sp. 8M]VXC06126.1 conserved hypothetical protein [Microbacterium sp. 8M]